MRKIDVVIPVYNEEKIIKKTLGEVLRFLEKNPNFTFIFVSDGSKDNTIYIIKEFIEKSNQDKIRLISYSQNKGKGNAIKVGVNNAKGDFICFIDVDLAYSLEHLNLLCKKLEENQVVIGHRVSSSPNYLSHVRPIRRLSGRVFNFLSRTILKLTFKDMQAGIKGFKKEVAHDLFNKQRILDFSFDTEIIYIAKKRKYSIIEVPAKLSEEHSYRASKVNLFKDSLKMFFSIIKIKLNDSKGYYD